MRRTLLITYPAVEAAAEPAVSAPPCDRDPSPTRRGLSKRERRALRSRGALEPPLMPRQGALVDGCCWRGWKDWPPRSGRRRSRRRLDRDEHRRPRGRGGTHPGRSSCVRNAVTPSGSGRDRASGKPTVRRAQSPGGNRMTEKRMPAVERQQETGTRWTSPSRLVVSDNWPIGYGPGARTRKRADAVR